MTSLRPYYQAAILGVGLIGSSVARAMREAEIADVIVGYDTNPAHLATAVELGVIDQAFDDLSAALASVSLVIVAAPVGASLDLIERAAIYSPDRTLIMDVGSTKGAIYHAAQRDENKGCHIVPCHPIAGTERSGPEAGFATLFKGRWCILTPLDRQDAPYLKAVENATDFWRKLGSEVEVMDAAHHDLALAATSHLPHLIAFTMMGAVEDLETVTEAEIVKYSAGGFRDFTRIAASDPVMWRDVFVHNKAAVLEVLGRFTEELIAMQRAIRWGDAETLEKAFARGRALRHAIVEAGQEKDVPNFGRDD
ncbi:MAG: prephenate/arogenate dehydrogenase family protein [Alphaproteobacteria bacterium]|nr:prephenate/arogenate dehydrogenase family protein [Alphaproteobacteria bacterium]